MIQVDIKLKRDNFNVIINETFDNGITGIYGPSGSGKTSLLNSICGLAKPQEGNITVNGKTLFSSTKKINVPVERRNIGYVFQEGRLFPHMTVEKNLMYGVRKDKPQKLSFDEIVDLLNLRHILKSRPSNISGGERQRTAIGRTLLSFPELLLLDEPFSAVDVNLRQQILPFLIEIQKRVNIPILVVSHDISDLLKLTNKLFIIQKGKCIGFDDYHHLIKQESVKEIFTGDVLLNAVTLKVKQVNHDTGLTILSADGKENFIKVLCEKSRTNYEPGEEIKIFIRSDDIALSATQLPGITIQNQLDGIITDIIERENIMLCVVDVGFPLIVEITAASLRRLNIRIGAPVWCLFKSVAIDVAG